jgi:hypothetical protein
MALGARSGGPSARAVDLRADFAEDRVAFCDRLLPAMAAELGLAAPLNRAISGLLALHEVGPDAGLGAFTRVPCPRGLWLS